LRQHKPATIVGKDFGARIVKKLERFAKRAKTIPRMLEDIQEWTREETARLLHQDPGTDVETVADEGACMVTVCQTAKSLEEAIATAKKLFVETPLPMQIALATTHAAKGDERKRVWVLADTYRWRDTLEEHNLWYVAVTRAMHTLYLVSDGTFNNGKAATSTWLRLPPEYA
jgi:superfamily I DNA/RNA helicase